jgi:hypothetical protein
VRHALSSALVLQVAAILRETAVLGGMLLEELVVVPSRITRRIALVYLPFMRLKLGAIAC